MGEGEFRLPQIQKKTRAPSRFAPLWQSLFLLAFVVLIAGTLRWMFSGAAIEKLSREDLAEKVSGGPIPTKRMAAAEWVRILESSKDLSFAPTAVETEALLLLWEPFGHIERTDVDPRLGVSIASRARLALVTFLKNVQGDHLVDIQVQSLVSLGRLGFGEPHDADVVFARIQDAQDSIRKAAAFTLGAWPQFERLTFSPELRSKCIESLKLALTDADEEVRWTAAIGLASYGDPEAGTILLKVLERYQASRLMTPIEIQWVKEAMNSSRRLQNPKIFELTNLYAKQHPVLEIRRFAQEIARQNR